MAPSPPILRMDSHFFEYLQSIIADEFSSAVAPLCKARKHFLESGQCRYLAEWEQLIFMLDPTLLPESTVKQNFETDLLAEALQLSAEAIGPAPIDDLAQHFMARHSAFRALHARYLIFGPEADSEREKGLRLLAECLTEDNITAHECARLVYESRLLGEEATAERWKTHAQSTSFRRIWNECDGVTDAGEALREIRSLIACGLPDKAAQKAEAEGSVTALFLLAEAQCLSGADVEQIKMSLKAAAAAGCSDAEILLKAPADNFLRRPDTLHKGRYALTMLAAEKQRQHNRFERLKAAFVQDVEDEIQRKEAKKIAEAAEQARAKAQEEARLAAEEEKRRKQEKKKGPLSRLFTKKETRKAPADEKQQIAAQTQATTEAAHKPLPPSQMRLAPKKKPLSLKKPNGKTSVKKSAVPTPLPAQQTERKSTSPGWTFRMLPWYLLRFMLHGVIAWLCFELVLFVFLFNRISGGSYGKMWILSELLIKIGTGLLWLFMAGGGVFSVWSCFSLKKKYGLRASIGVQLLTILQLGIALQMLAYTTLCCNGFISAFFSLCCFGVITLLLIFYKGSTVTDKQQAEECYIKLICLLILCEIFLYGCFDGAFNLIENLQTLHGLYRI